MGIANINQGSVFNGCYAVWKTSYDGRNWINFKGIFSIMGNIDGLVFCLYDNTLSTDFLFFIYMQETSTVVH